VAFKLLNDNMSSYIDYSAYRKNGNLIEKSKTTEFRKLLWNEIEFKDIENRVNSLYIAYLLFELGVFHEVDFKVTMNRLQQIDLIESTDVLNICYFGASEKDLANFESFIVYLVYHLKWLGAYWLDLNDVIGFAEEFKIKDINDVHRGIANKISSLISRPEYIEEIIGNLTDEELQQSFDWLPPQFRKDIVETSIEKELGNVDFSSPEKDFEDNGFLRDFPISFPVLEDKIASLEANAVETDIISQVPPDLLQQWLPKFVYTKPETIPKIKIMFPGGQHIGHSAVLIKINHGLILFDFGLSVVNAGHPKWMPIMEKLDAIFVTHAHLDHSGAIPFLLQNKNIPIFGTQETKIMCEMLWNDTYNLTHSNYANINSKINQNLKQIASQKNILNTIKNYNTIQRGTEISILPGVSIQAYDASHLFGSVGYEITIGNKRILYTGDFNVDGTKIFKGAKFPLDADLTIFDGTYFGRDDDNPVNLSKEADELKSIIQNSSRVLIPAFSMGRSQEVFYHLKKIGIDKKWTVHMTGMGGKLTKRISVPTIKETKPMLTVSGYVDPSEFIENTIVIGGQGMLQAGTSRRLFDATAQDESTSVIFTGYQAPNTLGYHLLNKNPYLITKYKQQFKRISMSGHTTSPTLDKFLDSLSGKELIVHSPIEANEAILKRGIGKVTTDGLTI